jgi:hypothetical protein
MLNYYYQCVMFMHNEPGCRIAMKPGCVALLCGWIVDWTFAKAGMEAGNYCDIDQHL